eukprot:11520769-Alexandrium_andersonii.AAC.1
MPIFQRSTPRCAVGRGCVDDAYFRVAKGVRRIGGALCDAPLSTAAVPSIPAPWQRGADATAEIFSG